MIRPGLDHAQVGTRAPFAGEPTHPAGLAEPAQIIYRSQALPQPAGETFTGTWGACRTGACELGPSDVFLVITEVCCTGGTCTTERYKLCGC